MASVSLVLWIGVHSSKKQGLWPKDIPKNVAAMAL